MLERIGKMEGLTPNDLGVTPSLWASDFSMVKQMFFPDFSFPPHSESVVPRHCFKVFRGTYHRFSYGFLEFRERKGRRN